jgi:hypothetical protein
MHNLVCKFFIISFVNISPGCVDKHFNERLDKFLSPIGVEAKGQCYKTFFSVIVTIEE